MAENEFALRNEPIAFQDLRGMKVMDTDGEKFGTAGSTHRSNQSYNNGSDGAQGIQECIHTERFCRKNWKQVCNVKGTSSNRIHGSHRHKRREGWKGGSGVQ